jgi:hypothetical protein
MKIIIAGGREFNDYNLLVEVCDIMLHKLHNIEIVSGKARGADSLGERYAKEKGYPVKEFPADWDGLGKGAGHIRNRQMAQYANCLLLFWNGNSKGSKNMLKEAQKENLQIKVINY